MSANPSTPTSLAEVRRQPVAAIEPDQKIDMFSLRGFELAQRIAKAFATSDAVPAQFRSHNLKKVKVGNEYNETWVENPAALGNCLVAIETARAVGMSITSVMQHANIIENRLTWSAQFVIGAINASGRFTPLRFDKLERGRLKAKYREKQGWNRQKGGFDFKDVEVEIDDIRCVAWALPKGIPEPRVTLEQMREFKGSLLQLYKALGMPVVESAPVSMKLAVEEGWYGKSGSKWQTEMRHLMLEYRAGAFFGRIHAPDIVMGMGRTTEEVLDMTTIDMDAAGNVTAVRAEELRRPAGESPATVVEVVQKNESGSSDGDSADPGPGNEADEDGVIGASAKTDKTDKIEKGAAVDVNALAEQLEKATSQEALDLVADSMRDVVDADAAQTLSDIYHRRQQELAHKAQAGNAPAQQQRRTRSSASNLE